MLKTLIPSHENPYIDSRNAAAHRFIIAQAPESTTGNRHIHLSKWIDLLATYEKDEEALIRDVTFQRGLSLQRRDY